MSNSNFTVIFYYTISIRMHFPLWIIRDIAVLPQLHNIQLLTLPLLYQLADWLHKCVWDKVRTQTHILPIFVRCCIFKEFKTSAQFRSILPLHGTFHYLSRIPYDLWLRRQMKTKTQKMRPRFVNRERILRKTIYWWLYFILFVFLNHIYSCSCRLY